MKFTKNRRVVEPWYAEVDGRSDADLSVRIGSILRQGRALAAPALRLNRNHAAKGNIMNPLIRWDPFKEMEETQNRLARILGLAPTRAGTGGQEAMTVTEWAPSVDIIEDDKEWLLKADLPEVKKEDVKVTVENGVLTITGERKFEKEEKDKRYHRIERSYGNFLRSFALPDAADGSKVNAEFKDGVLKVHLPKGEKAKPKAVEVKVS